MAKRKSVRKPRKKTQKTSAFLSTVKRVFIGAFIVVACLIGVLFIYDYFAVANQKPAVEEKKERTAAPARKPVTTPKKDAPKQ